MRVCAFDPTLMTFIGRMPGIVTLCCGAVGGVAVRYVLSGGCPPTGKGKWSCSCKICAVAATCTGSLTMVVCDGDSGRCQWRCSVGIWRSRCSTELSVHARVKFAEEAAGRCKLCVPRFAPYIAARPKASSEDGLECGDVGYVRTSVLETATHAGRGDGAGQPRQTDLVPPGSFSSPAMPSLLARGVGQSCVRAGCQLVLCGLRRLRGLRGLRELRELRGPRRLRWWLRSG